jgi:16S rRNA (uracil1498-N3)-methyltransferase
VRHAYRFFAESSEPGRALLRPSDRHHLEHVLRLRAGDTCEVVSGGRVHRARVEPDGLVLLDELEPAPPAPPLSVWIAQGGGRADTAVEKLTELGVAAIGALVCEHGKGAQPRRERWLRLAEAAAKQSGRDRLPRLVGPARFADVVTSGAVVLDPSGGPLGELDREGTLLVGPEPGFSPAELELARERGARVVSLGPARLRSETAAIVGAALALRALRWIP